MTTMIDAKWYKTNTQLNAVSLFGANSERAVTRLIAWITKSEPTELQWRNAYMILDGMVKVRNNCTSNIEALCKFKTIAAECGIDNIFDMTKGECDSLYFYWQRINTVERDFDDDYLWIGYDNE